MTTILLLILIILAVLLSLTGIIGAIVPAIPGPPISFASLLTVYFVCPGSISTELLIIMLIITIVVSILDYVAPIIFTKMGGGSKRAITFSTIGMIIGLFFMPLGLIIGPLAGAFIGEMSESENTGKAVKVALMSFVAFLLTTGFKLVASAIMTFYTFVAIFEHTRTILPDFSFL